MMQEQEVYELLMRAQGGDPRAQNEFIKQWRPLAASTFSEVLGCYVDNRHGCASDVLDAVAECIRVFDPQKGGIVAFIRLVAQRRAIDFLRRTHRARRRKQEVPFSDLSRGDEEDPISFEEWYADPRSLEEEVLRREEEQELSELFRKFNISPQWWQGRHHRDKLDRVGKVAGFVLESSEVLGEILKTREFPAKKIGIALAMSMKTVERYRDLVLVAILVTLHRKRRAN